MIQRAQIFIRIPIIIVLIFALIPITTIESSAKKKHHKRQKKETLRREAIDLIRSNSEQISELAGLQPLPQDSLRLTASNENLPEEGEDLAELEQEDDVTVDIEQFKSLWLSYVSDDEDDEMTAGGIKKSDIMNTIMNWLGTPYHFGGTNNGGIDCSAFVRMIFFTSSDVVLPRTAREQYTIGTPIKRGGLEFGDMVFFHTRSRVYISHVGIYLGDNLFAHSSSRGGVTVSSLESTYYNNRFVGGRRLSVTDIARMTINSPDDQQESH